MKDVNNLAFTSEGDHKCVQETCLAYKTHAYFEDGVLGTVDC